MEKERGTKIIAIMALAVGIIGLSIGFAAFSNQLDISTEANYKADPNEFSVDFSTLPTSISTENISVTTGGVTGATGDATNVVIDNSDPKNPTISNLVANFTAPGQTVTYTFYAVNNGLYDAFLKEIAATQLSGTEKYMDCTKTATSEADATLLENACKTIDVTITVGSETPAKLSYTGATGLNNEITEHKLAYDDSKIGESDTVTVKFTYGSTAPRVDGDFKVDFGKVSLTYKSVD